MQVNNFFVSFAVASTTLKRVNVFSEKIRFYKVDLRYGIEKSKFILIE